MDNPATQCFKARVTEFDVIQKFIESACAGMSSDDRQRVVLLVEELFTNTVNYGYGGECDEPVWISLSVGAEGCQIVYEDRAGAHDPFSIPDKGSSQSPAEDRPVGGLGILLLLSLSPRHSYERRGERNVIELNVLRTL